jgi:hypothetical protein
MYLFFPTLPTYTARVLLLVLLAGKLDLSSQGGLIDKGFKVKFVVRRMLVGIVASPLVAGVYAVGYVALALVAGDALPSLSSIVANGFLVASVVAVAFGFFTQVDKFISKIVGA